MGFSAGGEGVKEKDVEVCTCMHLRNKAPLNVYQEETRVCVFGY